MVRANLTKILLLIVPVSLRDVARQFPRLGSRRQSRSSIHSISSGATLTDWSLEALFSVVTSLRIEISAKYRGLSFLVPFLHHRLDHVGIEYLVRNRWTISERHLAYRFSRFWDCIGLFE